MQLEAEKNEEYVEKVKNELHVMMDREEIISKQYKHYKELYMNKETLQKELEGVIAELTQQIEKEKKDKKIRESLRDGTGLMDALQQQLDGFYDQSGIIEESGSMSDYDSQQNDDEDDDEFALDRIVKAQTHKHIVINPVMVDYKRRAHI